MKTCTFLASYGKHYIEDPNVDIASYLKRDGFDGGEPDHYAFYRRGENQLEAAKKLRERFDAEGVACPCYSRGMTIVEKGAEESIKLLKESVDVAEALGAKNLHHTLQNSFHSPKIPLWQKHVDLMVNVCREVAYYAGEKGINCIYEDQGYYVNTPDRLGEILSKIDLPNTGICLDTGNAYWNDIDPLGYASMLAPFVKHVHVKDILVKPFDKVPPHASGWYRTGENNLVRQIIVGHGVIDFEAIFSILMLAGYDGYYSVESGGCHYDTMGGLMESLKNMKDIYESARAKLIARGYLKESVEDIKKTYDSARAKLVELGEITE